ncbi:TELO2-interacting protein 1-like [Hondaea fermentalgiana]|uniref:TELO2-interacting protein 1-like n=1 Tax=Hondaea fermentalgiana TaxID=2315210 RepID=A0A2R5GC84_9STRA|nr:TELO2-interacting protein 1-like [Hondaea fermentalgiana]|eukprot:GBG27338.1 TELO2-interacting protein 1-like [Hondaea fermentalgiana]
MSPGARAAAVGRAPPLEQRAAFEALKPACMALMRAVCEKAALTLPAERGRDLELDAQAAYHCQQLSMIVKEQPSVSLEQCVEYVLLPLFKALPSLLAGRRDQGQASTTGTTQFELKWGELAWIALFNCVQSILSQCTPAFLAERPDIILQTLDASLAGLDLGKSEEVLYAAVSALRAAFGPNVNKARHFTGHGGATWQALAAPQGQNAVLHGLFAHTTLRLLETAKVQRARRLRIACLETAQVLLDGVGAARPEAVEEVLPGVSGVLGGIIMEDFKSGSTVRAAAIEAWTPAICCVLSDIRTISVPAETHASPDTHHENSNSPYEETASSAEKSGDNSESARKWAEYVSEQRPRRRPHLAETCARLDVMLRAILRHEHVSGPGSRVAQMSLVGLASCLIQECTRTMVDNSPAGPTRTLLSTLVEILVTMEVIEDPDTSALAQSARQECSQKLGNTTCASEVDEGVWGTHVAPALDECLRDALRELPSVARSKGEAAFRHSLATCEALIRSVGPTRLQVILDAWSPLQPILTTIELHKDHDERALVSSDYNTLHVAYPARRFVHFQEGATRDALDRMLTALFSSKAGARRELYSELLVCVQGTGASDRHEAWLLLAFLMRAAGSDLEPELCRDCVHVCVENLRADEVVSAASNGASRRLLVSLQLEVLGQCFLQQQEDQYGVARRLLVEALFPILVHASSERAIVADSATAALGCLAVGCGYANRVELIHENIDYLLDATSMWLEDLESFPQTANILLTLLRILRQAPLPQRIKPFLRDMIDGVLHALEMRRGDFGPKEAKLTSNLLGVLQAALRILPNGETHEESESIAPREEDPLGALVDEFESATRTFAEVNVDAIDETLDPSASNEDDPAGVGEDIAPKQEASFEENLAKTILLHCRHFTRHADLASRRLALEGVAQALRVLSGNRDELLPMIHEAWRGIEASLSSEQSAAVLAACFNVVTVCIRLAPDFMKRRYVHNGPWRVTCTSLRAAAQTRERRGQHEIELILGELACAESALTQLPRNSALAKESFLLGKLAIDLLPDESFRIGALRVLRAVATFSPDVLWLEVATFAIRNRDFACDKLDVDVSELPRESEMAQGLRALDNEELKEILQLMDSHA